MIKPEFMIDLVFLKSSMIHHFLLYILKCKILKYKKTENAIFTPTLSAWYIKLLSKNDYDFKQC